MNHNDLQTWRSGSNQVPGKALFQVTFWYVMCCYYVSYWLFWLLFAYADPVVFTNIRQKGALVSGGKYLNMRHR